MAERMNERKGGGGRQGGRMRGNGERTEATRRGFIWRRAISLLNFVGGSHSAKHVVIRSSKCARAVSPVRIQSIIYLSKIFVYKTIILSIGA